MSKHYLITTPLIETWDFDNKTLMLGNWCIPFDKKVEISRLMNNSILDYHWSDSEKTYKDYLYLNKFGDEVLSNLSEFLNNFHKINKSENYWRIILSNWLFSAIHIIYDRWETLQKAFENNKITHTKIININDEEMISQSIENFTDITFQDKWNHYIFSKILKYEYIDQIKFEEVSLKNDTYEKFFYKKFSFKNTILFQFYNFIRKIYFKFFKNEKYFITDSYLGKINEIKLNLKLGNFPITISPRTYFFTKPNKDLRKNISLKIKKNIKFENFFIEILPNLIPCSFLENYKNILKEVENSNYPKNPKVIFTSHAIDKKTLTSFYIAEKKEHGTILLHGQHGGAYGQNKFHWYEDFERRISDKFLTWGWKDDERTIPVGLLKPQKKFNRAKNNIKKKGNLILVMRPKERYFSTILDSRIRAPQMLDYHYDCMNMVECLNQEVKSNLILRLHERTYGWFEKDMWKHKFPYIKVDEGFQTINNSINSSKLSIYTYNSTGYLEFFVANIPTLLFWSNKDNPLNSEAANLFKELKSIKIFHEDKESLSKHVNKIWSDVDSWWFNNDVQKIRKKFCDKYAKINPNILNDIKSLILKEDAK